jgi:hypothetical protein
LFFLSIIHPFFISSCKLSKFCFTLSTFNSYILFSTLC